MHSFLTGKSLENLIPDNISGGKFRNEMCEEICEEYMEAVSFKEREREIIRHCFLKKFSD